MKEMIVPLCAILAVTTAKVIINIEGQDTPHLLGAKACTWGPSYWCTNITMASRCKAIKHCIPNVWEKMQVPEDNDSVCQICKKMVLQARDQLESNQTQEDLKAVFEGSCALMYVKPIVEECDKLVDDFIPELVETLASQMNPSVVCSVAGLCNSVHIDKLLEENKNQIKHKDLKLPIPLINDEYNPNECSKCHTIMHHMEYKFRQASRDNVLEQLINICGEFSSFSDACSSIVLTHFETIYSHLKTNFNAKNICHLSGQCSDRFHIHEDNIEKTVEIEIRPLSTVGKVEISDDLPCKLCEQLISHLRDLLVANTTETEFQQVLEGLCKQMKSFAPECKSIVEEYYPEIYSFLTKGLNSEIICQMGGICPAPGNKSGPIWPLVSHDNAEIAKNIMTEKNVESEALEVNNMQLPIERMTIPFNNIMLINNKYCPSCEFVIDYMKKNVKDLTNRDEVKLLLSEVKNNLPGFTEKSDESNFLSKYEIAVGELILEGKDLTKICSLIAVCPTNQQIESWKNIPSEFVEVSSVQEKPSCSMCLFAVSKLYTLVENDRTEAKIEAALDNLCNELPKSLNSQCIDLVKIYSKELIQLLINDVKPHEVCSYIKLCESSQYFENKFKLSFGEKIVAVPKNNVEGKEACALCEYVLHYIQQVITNPKAEEEVKQVIGKICKKLPDAIQNNCNEFIDTYGSALVAILVQEIDPSQICSMIHVCPSSELLETWKKALKQKIIETEIEDKPNCPLCLFGVTQLYNAIKDNKTEASIESALEKLCIHLPKSLTNQCETFVKLYSKQIIEMIIADFTPQEVCVYLQLCDPQKNVEPPLSFFPLDKTGEIMTNEIPDYPLHTVNALKLKNDIECAVCEFITKHVEELVKTPKSKNEIVHLLHKLCNDLPKHMSQKCNIYVEKYVEIVIDLLASEVSPKQICTIIDLCNSDTTSLRGISEPDNYDIKMMSRMKSPLSIAECALCQDVRSNIDMLLNNPEKNGNVEKVINEVCKNVEASEEEKCKLLISIHGKSIINIIKANGDMTKICNKLSYCSSNNFLLMLIKNERIRRQADDKNLGTKPCTWGISYWCVDDKTAEECKATELCKKKGRLPESTSTTTKTTSDNHEVASEAEKAVSEDAQSSS